MAVINVNLFSIYLKHNMDVTVVLPDDVMQGSGLDNSRIMSDGCEGGSDIQGNEVSLKCVWLYHGGSGDHTEWLYHTNLVDYVNERHFVAVLPNVHESCFVDMNIGGKYGSYVGKELPSTIWNMFRCISKKREDNYVAGFSNGGYGCLRTALKYPEKFSYVGAFSAGDKADSDFPNDGGAKSINRIRLYGDGDLHKTEYGLTYLADKLMEKMQSENMQAPVIYHACGGKDPWLNMNHIVRDYFLEHKENFVYTYDEIEELGHEWKFWDIELVKFLDFVGLQSADR